MSRRFVGFLLLVVSACTLPQAEAEPLWARFAPAQRIEADPTANYTLSETNGPWLVMAATFNGPEAADQARELVIELRQRFNLPAYQYQMQFNHQAENLGRGIDNYGQRIKRRYQTASSTEYAVLVGDFPSIDDSLAQDRLEFIKQIKPQALAKEFRETSQALAQEREFLRRITGSKSPGPMNKAFMTSNPILPAEYFKPKGVDDFVAKINKNVTHSLLDCPKRYSVQIATFKGRSQIGGGLKSSREDSGSNRGKVDPLTEAAEKAHFLTVFLRAKGWEAYEFHDRTESVVTVGSFDQVIQRGPGGQQLPIRNVQLILQTFGAAYRTQQDLTPLVSKGSPQVDPNAVKQQFLNVFNSEHGQIAGGLQPKYIQVVPDPKTRKVEVIPLDIHPKVVEAPKQTVSSAYVWSR